LFEVKVHSSKSGNQQVGHKSRVQLYGGTMFHETAKQMGKLLLLLFYNQPTYRHQWLNLDLDVKLSDHCMTHTIAVIERSLQHILDQTQTNAELI